jgi:hypothetical protein
MVYPFLIFIALTFKKKIEEVSILLSKSENSNIRKVKASKKSG